MHDRLQISQGGIVDRRGAENLLGQQRPADAAGGIADASAESGHDLRDDLRLAQQVMGDAIGIDDLRPEVCQGPGDG